MIFKADNLYLKEAKKIFTISKNVSSRLNRFNNIPSIPLYPPCLSTENFYCESYGDFILFPSRMESMKRQHLAIEAMQYVKTSLKLVLVGHADTYDYLEKLRKRVEHLQLQEKVKFLPYVSDEEKLSLYARCRAVLFPTFDEDYGYVIPEAFYSSKAVITCTDSGAPLEFVEDLKTGIICEPHSSNIAEALDTLDSQNLAKELGHNAHKKILDMNLSWDNVVKELTNIS
jgi:glycosyltransferase involved in cell wall biosynthesis